MGVEQTSLKQTRTQHCPSNRETVHQPSAGARSTTPEWWVRMPGSTLHMDGALPPTSLHCGGSRGQQLGGHELIKGSGTIRDTHLSWAWDTGEWLWAFSAELVGKGQDGGANKNSDQFKFWLSTYYQLIMTLSNILNSQFLSHKIETILITPVFYGYCKD